MLRHVATSDLKFHSITFYKYHNIGTTNTELYSHKIYYMNILRNKLHKALQSWKSISIDSNPSL